MENRNTTVNPFKILIVDDDPLVVKTLEKILYKRNYLFYSVNSGEEALANIDDIDPDMVLLDVFMPGMTGYDVCHEFNKRGITNRLPVIFLTSNDKTTEVIKGLQSGAVDYIIKPFNADELLARVSTHLELKYARERLRSVHLIKNRFFSLITNDIKDALTGVKGVANFLADELAEPHIDMDEVSKLASLLQADSNNLFHYVENITKWDAIESDFNEVAKEKIHSFGLVDELLNDKSNDISAKNLIVTVRVPQDVFIYTDKNALRNILSELITNAIKYSPEGTTLLIEGGFQNGSHFFLISDQGVGMEKDVVENLFRLDTPHLKTIGTKGEKGIGLGLIICNAWVKKLGGQISIISEKRKGTIVRVELPI